MQQLAETVSRFISKEDLLRPGDRIGLAVSAGADSVALLRLMLELRQELGILLAVIHFNHKLRGEDSEADEDFVKELSRQHQLEFFCGSGNTVRHGEKNHLSLEVAARSLRYEYFLNVLREGRLNRIATAHTLDDQAETVLLKLARGAGTRGLAGVYPKLQLDQSPSDGLHAAGVHNSIIRPLLAIRRRDIDLYLRGLGQTWREDRSNRDLRHSRNVVRHGILPRLERHLNPAVREALAETAEIARAEEEYWNARVTELVPQVLKPSNSADGGGTLDWHISSAQPKALRRRLIRAFAESLGFKLEFKHVEAVLKLASSGRHDQSIILPGNWKATCMGERLRFTPSSTSLSPDYDYILPVPGRIEIPEAHRLIEAVLVRRGIESAYNLDGALDPVLLPKELRVRNWRPGDRFWPGHSKSPKKIKQLLQDHRVTGIYRKAVPVIASGAEVIWVEGLPVPSTLRPRDVTEEVVIIQTTRL